MRPNEVLLHLLATPKVLLLMVCLALLCCHDECYVYRRMHSEMFDHKTRVVEKIANNE